MKRDKEEDKQKNIMGEEDLVKYFQILKECCAKSTRDLEKRE
jgi:hypothetical protein